MKTNLQIVLLLLITFLSGASVQGRTVYCSNCSTKFKQSMEYVKDVEQMIESVKRYQELVKQTEHDIKNTLNIPSNLQSQLVRQVSNSVMNIEKLNSYKADMDTLGQIFSSTWPELQDLAIDGVSMQDRIAERSRLYEEASTKLNAILQSNFQLSGKQLVELQDSGKFDSYLHDLTSTKKGRLQAIEAGNQINALTIKELRETRALLANYVQSQASESAQKQLAEKQTEQEMKKDQEKGINMQDDILLTP